MPPPCPTLCRLPAASLGLPWPHRSIPVPRLALAARRGRAVAARASSSSSSPDSSFGSRMEDSVKKTLADNPVVIYSKSWCSYSMEVKGLFKRIGVDPHVIELDHLDGLRPAHGRPPRCTTPRSLLLVWDLATMGVLRRRRLLLVMLLLPMTLMILGIARSCRFWDQTACLDGAMLCVGDGGKVDEDGEDPNVSAPYLARQRVWTLSEGCSGTTAAKGVREVDWTVHCS